MRRASARPVSLDDTVGDEDSTRLEERVADENADHPYEELELQTSLGLLTQLLSKLNSRESRILRYRFGLDGEREWSGVHYPEDDKRLTISLVWAASYTTLSRP